MSENRTKTIYAYIEDAEIDADGIGYILIRKHKKESMERTIKTIRPLKGKDVVIRIDVKWNLTLTSKA